MNKLIVILIVATAFLLPAQSSAETFFKVSGGPASITIGVNGSSETSGSGLAFNVAVGGQLQNTSVVVYGELLAIAAGEWNNCNDCMLTVGSRFPGLGVGWYSKNRFNVHGAIHPLTMKVRVNGTDVTNDEDNGVFFFLTLGKDWRTSDTDTLGVSLKAGSGSISDVAVGTSSINFVYTSVF